MNRGFTVIELVISMAIFGFMTALVVAKFGNFNQSTLFTDTAYDVALAIHTAQTYGISVKNVNANFSPAYGVDFSTASGGGCGTDTTLVLFADISPSAPTPPDGLCSGGDATVTTYKLTRGAKVSRLCAGTENNCSSAAAKVDLLDISFLRPNPDAKICGYNGTAWDCTHTYAKITLTATDGNTRTIAVRQNGQITVLKQ